MAKESDLEARVAVCNHVNVLYIPQSHGLEGLELDTVTTASVKPNQTAAVVDRLDGLDKTLAAGDRPLDPGMIAARLGAQLERAMATAEMVRVFARRTDLRLVLDQAQITSLILAGVRSGIWEYQDPERGESGWATKDQPSAAVRIAEDTFIHPTGSAPVPEADEIIDLPPPKVLPPSGGYGASGKADVAIAQARQKAADGRAENLRSLRISIDETGGGTGIELAKLQSLVPPGTTGLTLRYEIESSIDLGAPGETLKVSFAGSAGAYAPLKSALDQLLRVHEAVTRAALVARFDPPVPISGQEVEEIRRRAADTGPTKCSISLSPEEKA
jgi:hypothetical protein